MQIMKKIGVVMARGTLRTNSKKITNQIVAIITDAANDK